MPAPTQVKIYSIDKILQSRGKLSTVEKINHLIDLQEALKEKLKQKQEMRKQAKAQASARGKSVENPEEERTSSLSEEKEIKVSSAEQKEAASRVSGVEEAVAERPRSSGPFKVTTFARTFEE